MNATDRGHIEEIITHLKKVETDYHINLTSEKEWLRGLAKEESVNEDLEKEIDSYFAKWLQGASDEGCFNPDSQLVSIYDCHRIARHFANWQKQKDSIPVSEELEQAANNAVIALVPSFGQKYSDGSYVSCYRGSFERQELLNLFKAGAQWHKEHLMANAVDVEVKVDAGGHPYVDRTIELYDYDKDIPLAKKGDKYKVFLIKED